MLTVYKLAGLLIC